MRYNYQEVPCPVCGMKQPRFLCKTTELPYDPSARSVAGGLSCRILIDSTDEREQVRIYQGAYWTMEVIEWNGMYLLHIPFSLDTGC